MKTRDLTKVAICVSLLCVSAYISIPLPFTPAMITSLTIVLNLIALVLTPKEAFLTLAIYTLLGAIGIPVFTAGTAGLGKIFGPTGGFIIAYIIAAPIMSMLKGDNNNFKRYLSVTILVGMPILYIGGTISMCIVQGIGVMEALTMSVFPFVIGDIAKCIGASFIAVKLNKVVFKSIRG